MMLDAKKYLFSVFEHNLDSIVAGAKWSDSHWFSSAHGLLM